MEAASNGRRALPTRSRGAPTAFAKIGARRPADCGINGAQEATRMPAPDRLAAARAGESLAHVTPPARQTVSVRQLRQLREQTLHPRWRLPLAELPNRSNGKSQASGDR
jgi:hypothetical protein